MLGHEFKQAKSRHQAIRNSLNELNKKGAHAGLEEAKQVWSRYSKNGRGCRVATCLLEWAPLQVRGFIDRDNQNVSGLTKKVMVSDFNCTITKLNLHKGLSCEKGRGERAWLKSTFKDAASCNIQRAIQKFCNDHKSGQGEADVNDIIRENLSSATGLCLKFMGGTKRATAVVEWIQSFRGSFSISSNGLAKEVLDFLLALEKALRVPVLNAILSIHGTDGVLDPITRSVEADDIAHHVKPSFAKELKAMGEKTKMNLVLGYISNDDAFVEVLESEHVKCFKYLKQESLRVSEEQVFQTQAWFLGVDDPELQTMLGSERKNLSSILQKACQGDSVAKYVIGVALVRAGRFCDGIPWLDKAATDGITLAWTERLWWDKWNCSREAREKLRAGTITIPQYVAEKEKFTKVFEDTLRERGIPSKKIPRKEFLSMRSTDAFTKMGRFLYPGFYQ